MLLFSLWVMSNSLWPHGLWPARLLCPWDFPGKNTGVGFYFFLQGIFSTQESNPCLLFGRQLGKPKISWINVKDLILGDQGLSLHTWKYWVVYNLYHVHARFLHTLLYCRSSLFSLYSLDLPYCLGITTYLLGINAKYTSLTSPDRTSSLLLCFYNKAGSWQKALQLVQIKKLFTKEQANAFRD